MFKHLITLQLLQDNGLAPETAKLVLEDMIDAKELVTSLEAEIFILREQFTTKHNENKQLQEQLTTLREENGLLKGQVESLGEMVGVMADADEERLAKYLKLQEEYDKLRKHIAGLIKERGKRNKKL